MRNPIAVSVLPALISRTERTRPLTSFYLHFLARRVTGTGLDATRTTGMDFIQDFVASSALDSQPDIQLLIVAALRRCVRRMATTIS